ncbi:MAG: type I-E CRISPR-associated protein Cas6/Cse3/CasE [Gammaproteobacteria bacterium]
MYLTRISLQPHPDIGALLHHLGDAYREHQMLWRLFDEDRDAQRDFLYRRDPHQRGPRYFLLSKRPPGNDLGLWRIDPPKPFQPRLTPGQQLAFSLRANPVISRDGRRHDVVMDAKHRMGWKRLPQAGRPPLQQLVHEAGAAWLRERAARHGFAVDEELLRVEAYQQHATRRGNRVIRFSTLDFAGLLTVTEPGSFSKALAKGIGPAKAFGCGLLLVRRV